MFSTITLIADSTEESLADASGCDRRPEESLADASGCDRSAGAIERLALMHGYTLLSRSVNLVRLHGVAMHGMLLMRAGFDEKGETSVDRFD